MKRTKQSVETLKTEFNKNGLPYTLVKRNQYVAMYGIGGEYNPEVKHWEVCRIVKFPAQTMFGKQYPERERLPSNENFGRDTVKGNIQLTSVCMNDRARAERHFNRLTTAIMALPEDERYP